MPLAVFRRTFLAFAALVLAAYAVAAEEEEKKKAQEFEFEDITLSVPADWEKQEKTDYPFQLAQFTIPPAEGEEALVKLTVSRAGGGMDANIQRWLGQFSPEGRQVKVTRGESKQGAYYFVDVAGTYNMPAGPQKTEAVPNARMFGVIIDKKDKGTYFLKMAGPEKTVSAQEEALRASIGGDAKSEKPYEVQ